MHRTNHDGSSYIADDDDGAVITAFAVTFILTDHELDSRPL